MSDLVGSSMFVFSACHGLYYLPVYVFVMFGASCSKLTTSLVNDSFKFQMAILQMHCHFLLKKCENPLQRILSFFSTKNAKDSHILSTKNDSVFAYVVGIYLTS